MPKPNPQQQPRNPQQFPLPICKSCDRRKWNVASIDPEVRLKCRHCGGERTVTLAEWREEA